MDQIFNSRSDVLPPFLLIAGFPIGIVAAIILVLILRKVAASSIYYRAWTPIWIAITYWGMWGESLLKRTLNTFRLPDGPGGGGEIIIAIIALNIWFVCFAPAYVALIYVLATAPVSEGQPITSRQVSVVFGGISLLLFVAYGCYISQVRLSHRFPIPF